MADARTAKTTALAPAHQNTLERQRLQTPPGADAYLPEPAHLSRSPHIPPGGP